MCPWQCSWERWSVPARSLPSLAGGRSNSGAASLRHRAISRPACRRVGALTSGLATSSLHGSQCSASLRSQVWACPPTSCSSSRRHKVKGDLFAECRSAGELSPDEALAGLRRRWRRIDSTDG